MFHPFRYQGEVEQCLVDTEEWDEVRMREPFPDHCFVAKVLIQTHLPFRIGEIGI